MILEIEVLKSNIDTTLESMAHAIKRYGLDFVIDEIQRHAAEKFTDEDLQNFLAGFKSGLNAFTVNELTISEQIEQLDQLLIQRRTRKTT